MNTNEARKVLTDAVPLLTDASTGSLWSRRLADAITVVVPPPTYEFNPEAFLQAVTQLVDQFQEDEGETLDANYIVLSVIATVDNCVDELTSIEYVVRPAGYAIRYTTVDGQPVIDEAMDDWLSRGLKMAEEDVYLAQAGD
jgi:hypothetical protein